LRTRLLWPADPGIHQVYRTTLQRIETATASTKSLPLPAEGTPEGAFPIAVAPPEGPPESGTVPVASPDGAVRAPGREPALQAGSCGGRLVDRLLGSLRTWLCGRSENEGAG
jgi:hypothetical protein